MTELQECLYQYISDRQYPALQKDEEYMSAQLIRNEAENVLSAGLNEEQKRLFSQYMDEENHLVSLELRHIFQETLRIMQSLFHFP